MAFNYGPAGFWVHGAPAKTLEQVVMYLTGDAHDRSKVQWFDGQGNFTNVIDTFPTEN